MQFAPKRAVPVFPLPGLVLFPHALVPLHVFELRYRTLVREALSGERLIALALLRPGWERDYHGSPEFHSIGCLARFEEVEWLPNDCYDLRVLGLARVRFERVEREFPYRACRVSLLPEAPLGDDDPLVQIEKRALLDACARLAATLGRAGEIEIAHATTYEGLVNHACTVLPMDPLDKLALLENDSVIERGRLVREWVERRLRGTPTRGTQGPGDLN
jgi:Lon protease-like protein